MLKYSVITVSALALFACSGQETKAPQSDAPSAAAPAANSQAVQSENERIDAFFEENFNAALKRYPEFMTQFGMKVDYDKWNDPSQAFSDAELAITRAELAKLRAEFDFNKLGESQKISYRLFELNAENELAGEKWQHHGYPFNQMFGVHSRSAAFLINFHRIDNVDDAKAYIGRLNGMKDYLGVHTANSKKAAAKGIMPPKFVYAHVIRDSNNVLTGAPFTEGADSTLMADFRKKVGALEIDEAEKDALYGEASAALLSSVKPAYEALLGEMKTQQAVANTDDGVWKLPDGDKFYEHRLGLMTTTDMTAKEIHDLGVSEVARIHTEMRAIMAKVGFEGDLQDFFAHLKTDPKFVYEDSDAGRDAYLAEAERLINVMKGDLDEVFKRKPKADLIVKRVEAFREKSAGKAFYNRPAADGSRPGIYYANLYKITDMPKYQMEALAYHEGIPGHHMQLAIAQELKDVPKFRKFGGFTAYTEGWGLYSEYLPKEMGYYSDPYSDFGRLAMELWRAARLVVDTGLHDKKWTREQAIQYLVDNTPNPKNDCVKAIERYIVMPGQATAYKVGMLKILELRENAKTKLGSKFDLAEFHDVVLAEGAVPLNVLETRVKNWADSK